MKKFSLLLLIIILMQSAHASLIVTDKDELASVTLHTEIIQASKRVYLAADFEAKHTNGMIGCHLKIEHKNGLSTGSVYHLEESTSLLPKENISFNLGLFPERFHASGLDVKANLICRRVTFFDKFKKTKKLVKSNPPTEKICCRLSPIHLNCATQPDDSSVEINKTTQLNLIQKDPNDYPSCWPQDEED